MTLDLLSINGFRSSLLYLIIPTPYPLPFGLLGFWILGGISYPPNPPTKGLCPLETLLMLRPYGLASELINLKPLKDTGGVNPPRPPNSMGGIPPHPPPIPNKQRIPPFPPYPSRALRVFFFWFGLFFGFLVSYLRFGGYGGFPPIELIASVSEQSGGS